MEYEPVRIFKALSNPSRLKILETIYKEGICGAFNDDLSHVEGCTCVGDIVNKFNLAPSTISSHLRELSLAGLIQVLRDGKFVRIFPNPEAMKAISEYSDSLVKGFE